MFNCKHLYSEFSMFRILIENLNDRLDLYQVLCEIFLKKVETSKVLLLMPQRRSFNFRYESPALAKLSYRQRQT